MVRRLAGSEITDGGDHLIVRTPANPTFYWGNFILVGTPLGPGDAERWLDVFTTEFPGAQHRSIGVDDVHGHAGDISAGSGATMGVDVSTVLRAAHVHEPEHWARDAVCRPLEGDEDWEQWWDVRWSIALEDGEGSERHAVFLRRSVDEARRLAESGHATFFGAFVVGRCRSGLGIVSDGGGTARYQSVETHPDARRRGLAGALVYAAGRHALRQWAARELVIVADPDGPAIDLYRSIGFADAERQVQLLRPPPSTSD